MGAYLSFKKMLTPILIQVVFWLGSLVSVGVGALMIFNPSMIPLPANGLGGPDPLTGAGTVGGIILIVLGPIVVRLACEGMIVVFSINNTLTEIRKSLDNEIT
ncbi:MAG: DUF4282 domain-containing protein [Planctomycetaceae bacterium]